MWSKFQEGIKGIREVHAFNQEDEMEEKISNKSKDVINNIKQNIDEHLDHKNEHSNNHYYHTFNHYFSSLTIISVFEYSAHFSFTLSSFQQSP